ncbi:MAG: GTPase Era [Candidatus Omnitrophica bacterium]|nr:GTPase Era [Candidatus Omnitrophota bacterium]
MPALRSGFVGLVGRPNVGKSTMLNWFVGEKVAIVSPHPQTTRHRIAGVLHRPGAQVIFLDTPGLHKPQHALGRSMVEAAKAVLEDADVLVAVIDARGLTPEDERVFERVQRSRRPALLAINKIDLVKKPRLLPLLDACAKLGAFGECVPVCARSGEQMERLLERLIPLLPEGPSWYEPHQHTDQRVQQRIAELIREPILLATRQEVPHAVAVRLDELEEGDRLTRINATILVEREGQKAILIGRGGLMLKRIGQEARRHIEQLLGHQVYLQLWVKVAEDWRGDERMLRELGYRG